ncbi:MFS transporter [Psychrobacillus psychrotolerans]|uniref:MFS transporter n=1 Tax=Psychrobacillus psychrotolerans TaxID=126156 RepID=UPI0033146225
MFQIKNLYKDSRFRLIISANIASSIGSGITMIAIPWMLVSSDDGNKVFGFITIGMTILSFILTPFIGNLVDKVSRKKLLIVSEIVCFVLLFIFSLLGFMGLPYEIWHYTIIYMIGSLYYTIFYPTMFALNQEIFTKDHYKSLNGTMEVQGQLSSMIAGGLASILLMKWELHYILLLNTISYGAAIFFYLKLPYVRLPTIKTEVVKSQVSEGIRYMLARPAVFIFLLFSFMPFIGVMLTNYLFPVYLVDVLEADASVYGIEGMIYAIGAVIAGVFVPTLSSKFGNEKTIIFGILVYTIAISLIVFVDLPVYLSLMLFLAIGNSSTRVARNSFLMDHIPNNIIGRVDSLFRTSGLLIRILLLALFTEMVSSDLIVYCFIVLSGILMVSLSLVLISLKKGVKEKEINCPVIANT